MIYDTSKELEVNKLLSRLDALLSKKCIIELKEKKKPRTLSQNAYLHVCITLFAIAFGYDLENAKYLLKSMCPFMHYYKDGVLLVYSTSKQDTKEQTDFIEWIRTKSAKEGHYIASPQEYLDNKYAIDSEIEKFKEYL